MNGNPLQRIVQMLNMGQNPMGYLQSMAQSDPQVNQFMKMVNGKSPQQLRQMAENMAKERNISINDVIRQLGIAAPSGR